MTLIFKINGTDYGPSGLNLLQSFSPEPSGPGKIGQGTATLLQAAGGADIRTRMEVQAYEDDGTGHVTAVYYGGFVAKRDTSVLPGSTVKTWTLQLQDYNVLLKHLVSKAAAAQGIRISGASYPHFSQQVEQLFTQLQTGASSSIDAVSQVVDLVASGMPDAYFTGKSLNSMLQTLCANAQKITPALRPRFYIGPDTAVPRGSFGGPVLYVYDAASPPVAVMDFSDAPTGGQKSILVGEGYQRSLDAADQVNWRQGVHQATGAVYTASDATSISTYPNPYDPEGAWKDEPIVTTETTAGAAFQAKLNATVAATAYPRETLTQATDAIPPPLPGQYVTDTLSLEGLSAEVYQVASSSVEFPGVGTAVVRSRLELGLPRLLLGDEATVGVTGPPVEGDAVPPDGPATFTLTSNTYNYTTDLAELTFTWAAATAGDVGGYIVEVYMNGGISRQQTDAATLTAAFTTFAAGLAFTATVWAFDTSGNEGAPFTPYLSGTTASPAVPSAPTWPVAWNPVNAYDPASHTTRVQVTWNANAAGEAVTAYRATVEDVTGISRSYTLDRTITTLVLPHEVPDWPLTFYVHARNVAGESAASAAKTVTTDRAPAVGATLNNGSFEVAASRGGTVAAYWTATLTNSGTATRTTAGGATDGQWAMALARPTGTDGALLKSDPISAAGSGETFHIRFDYKATTAFAVALVGYDDTGVGVGTIQTFTPGTFTGSWQTYDSTVTLSAVPSATQMRVQISPTAAGTIYIDNLHLDHAKNTYDLLDAAVTNAKLQYGTPVAQSGTTGSRPGSPVTGQTYFDTTLKLPIWWSGTAWVDATGTSV